LVAEADPSFDVAIIGAGITGCAAALGMSRLGLRTALIGPTPAPFVRSDESPIDPRIYALSPASVEFLDRLRVWDHGAAARRQDVTRMNVFGDAGGRLTFDAWQQAVGRLAVIVEESESLRALEAGCRYAPIERREVVLERLEWGGPTAKVLLGDRRRLGARLVVGADGSRSAVRAAAGINAQVQPYLQTAIVANFALQRPHGGVAWQWFSAAGVVALLPLPGDMMSLVWSAPDQVAAELLGADQRAFAHRVEAQTGESAGAIGPLRLVGRPAGFPLQRLAVDAFVRPRVALVGDAAHVVHPLAGQGLNLGLQDVSELLRILEQATRRGEDPGDLRTLHAYARARAEPVQAMRIMTDGLARLFAASSPPVRSLRNLGMNLVNRAGPLKHILVRRALG
jgi:ubiquinone biosynthesis UbiH/UbiF/VisC/COQ6 family hydroxylase